MNLEKLYSSGSEKTPVISFDSVSGVFSIEGISIPEDTLGVYEPIFVWLDNYLDNPSSSTVLSVTMKFFNTSSSKCLYSIFRKLEALHKSGKTVKIVWYYKLEDTDMYESGQDFKNLLSVPFSLDRN